VRFRSCSPLQFNLVIVVVNLRPGRAIRGISGTLRREGRGECCGYFEIFLCGSPRLCRLRTEGLVPVSKY
jgi:hypothetical protein